ncbi:MAG TPA: DUF2142 domain-containing protein, partial [Verrucomicrobiae bacterium]|nr:DUF2142 domain-containing protein [Verrucomicrobiae bacterium]
YAMTYGSPEFTGLPQQSPGGQFPAPFWWKAANEPAARLQAFQKAEVDWQTARTLPYWQNYESSQQPLYYALAGAWWRLEKIAGLTGLRALYGLRFFNMLPVIAFVWLAHRIARLVFPENIFMRLGVPALAAIFPQQSFYSIQNDVLSPVCGGLVVFTLIQLWHADAPGMRPGIFAGLAMAAAFLAKLGNAPLLAISALLVLAKIVCLHRTGKLRAAWPAMAALCICAALPTAAWLAWTKHAFGDYPGTAAKIAFITWTPKPFAEWWHHPLFTPQGFWTFLSELIAAFWQGEIHWHNAPFDVPLLEAGYVVASLTFILLALVHSRRAGGGQRWMLWFSFACLAAGVMFLASLSIRFDFGISPDPSRQHPYFIAGRLLTGALIPFLLLFIHGFDRVLRHAPNTAKLTALAALLLVFLAAEAVAMAPVFHSQYNWYHL